MKQKLGRYIIEEQLGEGSFAYVYRALDPELERHVALKVLRPAWLSDPAAVARFKQEARTMAKLDKSPHIAVVYEVGEDKGQVYLAQLLVDGETLAARLTRGSLAWSKVLDILRPIASALDYAHSQGVIHRDIKPSNILLDRVGQAYLSDFGLVRAAEGSMSLSASVGGVKGTAAYIAPEVWDAEESTPATDVYALSCVVFEMLTGTVLFDGSSMMAVMRQHDKGPRFPAAWPEGVPAGVTEVLQRGLAADPNKRIQSGSELLAALTALGPAMADEAEVLTIPPPSAPAAEGMWLVSSTGQRYPLRPGTLTMGRSAKCDIQVNDPLASRQHATLEFDGEICRVCDEGSANGTFVNGQRVTAAGRALQPGDQLRIGEMTFSLSATVPATPVPAPPADEAEATITPPVDEQAKTAMPTMAVVEETPPAASPTQPRASKGLLAGGALALLGGGLVLVVLVGAILFFVIDGEPTPAPTEEAIVIEETKEVSGETVVETVEVEKIVKETVEVEVPAEEPVSADALPRNEALYFNGQQWGPVYGWNPYYNGNNNAMAIYERDNARVIMFETPYLYNMLDGQVYPLLADGPFEWDDEMTELTFKIKPAAKWSDGTSVTAEDVAYTWASHVKYNTTAGATNKYYIDTIEAVDPQTVVVKAKLGKDGKALNPLIVNAYLSTYYVSQKAWTETLEERAGDDAEAFISDTAEDVVYSGPYHKFFADDTKVVYVRDDNYWGQDASMWGKLPVPKYLAHTIFKDNDAGSEAFAKGEVDVSQQFNSDVHLLWESYGLPISTYLPEPPYNIGASLPTAFYNLESHGLDQLAVRKAIAIAVDYPTLIVNAMTNQSATFEQVPRSLMNPTPGEQALYDHDAVADLQWAGNDIEGAKALLDEAGIVDTDGDGWREYEGENLHYVATCPNGWTDWQAAIEVVAAAGKEIGIDIISNYPEWAVYQTVVTRSDAPLPEGYDIFMMWSDGAGPTQPWGRIRKMMSSEFIGMSSNWYGNWGQYSNPEVDVLIQAIPGETDPDKLKEMYTRLVEIYLTDVPSFTLMYRPQAFHAVNETVWTGFPHKGDGSEPPVPPLNCTDGWSIACLYNLELVEQ